MIRRSVEGIEVQRLDGIDRLQRALHLGPARQPQQAFTARADITDRRAGFAGTDGTQDVDARDDGAVIVCSPSYKAKMLPGAKPTVLRRRSVICSEAIRPNRIHRWKRFSIQIRST